jgi:ABC-type polysaccharide/polyol phosphate export permease
MVRLNPAYYLLEIYRAVLFYGRFPGPEILVPFLVFSIVLFILSILFFRNTKRGFGELL